MDPAATETVAVAAPGLVLQVIPASVTLVTGELLTGWRTAAIEVVDPAIRVFQMSNSNIHRISGTLG